MNQVSETLLYHMRLCLGQAHQAERAGDHERADALGAAAANKLALAIREDNVTELNRAARFRG